MRMFYYYVDSDGTAKGPVSIYHFKENPINGHSWVWHEGLPQWVEVHTVPSLRKYMRSDIPKSFSTKKGIIDLEAEKNKIPTLNNNPSELDVLRNSIPKSWLAESILITIFCCIPFGLVAIIYASRVVAYWRRGLYAESIAASNLAAFWVKLSLILTISAWIIYTLLWMFTPIAERSVIWYNNYFTSPM